MMPIESRPQRYTGYSSNNEDPVSFWQWVGTLFIMMIPGIGLIMVIYWALSAHTNTSKRNYARALLLFQIPLVIVMVAICASMAIPAFQKVRSSALERSGAAASAHQADSRLAITLDPSRKFNEPMRRLTGIDGRTMDATVTGFVGEQVCVQRIDGMIFTIDIARFSADDIAYFKRIRGNHGTH
jgi:hypothetical protein